MLLEFLRIIMLHFYVVVKYCKLAQSYYAEKLQLSVVSVEDPTPVQKFPCMPPALEASM